MLYTALVSASTPVALRYLYLTPHPPTAVVLASIQTAFGAAILCLITGAQQILAITARHLHAWGAGMVHANTVGPIDRAHCIGMWISHFPGTLLPCGLAIASGCHVQGA